jgi:hypothetical protein
MSFARKLIISWVITGLVLGGGSWIQRVRAASTLFASTPPANKAFKAELRYLSNTKRLTEQERAVIESEVREVEATLGVPRALLWCVLFQESRFDAFKNATSPLPAKGLGQFTPSALAELNSDTDHYDPRTSLALQTILAPRTLPIDFHLKVKKRTKGKRAAASVAPPFPEQPPNSYFRTATAVFASGAYLNNRYQQLKNTLDHQNVSYDPEVLWLYAAAAYNKGSRSVFLLLSNEYMSRGAEALAALLKNSKDAYKLLTHAERLDISLRGVWKKEQRGRYVEELLRNMAIISSCSLSEHQI